MTAGPAHRVSPEDYLAMEDLSDTRNELINGVVVAMSGNTYSHLRIVRNLVVALDARLQGKPCEILFNELRVKVELTGDYFYPDLVGVCGSPVFDRLSQITLLNPTLLIEVLSPSTEAYDRGQKFLHYQQIPSLREYVLVAQDEPRVELYTRGEDSAWTYNRISGAEATVSFSSIDCALPLAAIYRDVAFGQPNI
jgi:Uma2 family endonuclease